MINRGSLVETFVSGNEVTKVTRHTYPTEYAQHLAVNVCTYANMLDEEPLNAVSLGGVEIIPDAERPHELSRLKHSVNRVSGLSVAALPEAPRQAATKEIVGHIAAMSDLPNDPNALRVGVDASTQNFHVDQDGHPVLVDLLPPLNRDSEGSFPIYNLMRPTTPLSRAFLPWAFGTKSGAITKILSSSIDRGQGAAERVRGVFHNIDDAWYDMLPNTLLATIRDSVRRQLRLHMVPYLAASIAQEKLRLRR